MVPSRVTTSARRPAETKLQPLFSSPVGCQLVATDPLYKAATVSNKLSLNQTLPHKRLFHLQQYQREPTQALFLFYLLFRWGPGAPLFSISKIFPSYLSHIPLSIYSGMGCYIRFTLLIRQCLKLILRGIAN